MNLVAHQLLSYNRPKWQVGNHLGEMVRGKQYLNYEPAVQTGILLHRYIDSYTDAHPMVKQSTARLHGSNGKFSPILVDIFYDYFLIKHWDKFAETSFLEFRMECYKLLQENMDLYNEKLCKFTKAMIQYDWFLAYSTFEGIEKTLQAMSHRTKFPNNMYKAVKELYMDEDKFEADFLAFFPDIINATKAFLNIEK